MRIHGYVGLSASSVERLTRKFAHVELPGTNDDDKFVDGVLNSKPSNHEQRHNAELPPAREQFIAAVRRGPPASTAAKVSQLVAAGRVRAEGSDGPHVNIFHEAFARFRAKFLDVSTQIPPEVYHNVTTLFGKSQTVYPEEKDRAEIVGPIIEKLIDNDCMQPKVKGAIPDGAVITAMAGRPTAYRAFLEFKNEIGTGGSDPVAQGAKVYEKAWAEQKVRHTEGNAIYRLTSHVDQRSSCIVLLSELHHRHRWAMDLHSRGGAHRRGTGRSVDRIHLARAR